MKTIKFRTILLSLLCCFSSMNIAKAELHKIPNEIKQHLEYLGYSLQVGTDSKYVIARQSGKFPFYVFPITNQGFNFTNFLVLGSKNNFDIEGYKKLNEANTKGPIKFSIAKIGDSYKLMMELSHYENYNKETFSSFVDLYQNKAIVQLVFLIDYIEKLQNKMKK